MSDIEVIDDFLEKEDFKQIQDIVFSPFFPWYYNDSKICINDNNFQDIQNNFQFVHALYENQNINSEYIKYFQKFIEKLNLTSVVRIKLNLTTKTNDVIKYPLHKDGHDLKMRSAVYYLNSNDGITYFEDQNYINSVENRIVLFPSTLLHSGSTCTDRNIRVVLNVVYFVGDK